MATNNLAAFVLHFPPLPSLPSCPQVATISWVSADKKTVYLTGPLQFQHYG